MKANTRTIYIAVASLFTGLLIGWLIFGGLNSSSEKSDQAFDSAQVESETIWTCSMHPQIRRNEPGLCPICEMELIPLESMTSDDPMKLQMTEEAVKLAGVRTTPVEWMTVGGSDLELPGKVQIDQNNVVNLVSHVPGRIEKLLVNYEGERVMKGQRIARIYSPELISAQAELRKAAKMKETNPSLYRAVVDKLMFWKIEEAEIERFLESEELIDEFDIHAEAGGVITRKFVELGDYLRKGSPILQVTDLSRVWVTFEAYEDDLPLIRQGTRVRFTTPSSPGATFSGNIDFIDPILDEKTRTVSVRAVVNNRNGVLKPGMLLYGHISDEKSEGGLFVPRSAVLWTGERSVVYLQDTSSEIPTFMYREVVLGEEVSDMVRVKEGLERGEVVVTRGNFAIDAEAQLNNKSSMMNGRITISGREASKMEHPDFSGMIDEEFRFGIDTMISSYLALKNGLVESEARKSEMMANKMISIISNMEIGSEHEKMQSFWSELKKSLVDQLSMFAEADLEEQRVLFAGLTPDIISVVRSFKWRGGSLYVQFCPMALNDAGAEWISEIENIRNPYFGDKMLKCGQTMDTL